MTLSKAKQSALLLLSRQESNDGWIAIATLQRHGVQRQTLNSMATAKLVTISARKHPAHPAGLTECVKLTADGRTEITDMEKQSL